MPSVRERVERKQAARIKELEAEVAALKAQVAALSVYSTYVPAYGWYCGCGAWVPNGSTHQCTGAKPYGYVLTMGSSTGAEVTCN